MTTGFCKGALAALLLALGLSGCARFTHYNTERQVTAGAGIAHQVFVDAKQRMILSAPVRTSRTTYDQRGRSSTSTETFMRYCAEPSPDALSALATSGSGNLSTQDKLSIGAAFSLSESASSIGLRTQSIQMMRDAMFRLCEGAASGLLDSAQFEALQRRFQNSMVAILAIEQLTGAVRGPSASISTTARVGSAELMAKLTDQVVTTRSALAAAEADAKAKATAATQADEAAKKFVKDKGKDKPEDLTEADKPEYQKLKAAGDKAKADKDAADKVIAARQADLANYQTALTAAQTGAPATTATATGTAAEQRTLDQASIETLGTSVQAIVAQTLELGYFREICATLFLSEIEGRSHPDYKVDGLAKKCLAYAQQTVTLAKVSAERGQAEARLLVPQAGKVQYLQDRVTNEALSQAILDAIAAAPAPPH